MADLWVQTSWRRLQQRRIKTAFSITELVQLTSDFSKKYARGCTAYTIRTDPSTFLLVYQVKCNKRDSKGRLVSDPKGHTVRVKFDPSKIEDSSSVDNLDVRLSCSCVAPGSWVRMADGTEKQICDVVVGDEVITHKGRSRKVLAVTSRKAKPEEKAYELKAKGYKQPLVLSGDHPVAVVRGYEECACGCGKKLQLIYKGGNVRGRWARKYATGHGSRGRDVLIDVSGGQSLWRTPTELVKNEQLYFPQFEWNGSTEVDLDFASLVGYYLAKGDLITSTIEVSQPEALWSELLSLPDGRQKYLYGINIALNTSERNTLVADVKRIVEKLYPEAKVNFSKNGSNNGCQLEITHPQLAKRLVDLVGHGSLQKKFSREIFTWKADAVKVLVASWALGGGRVGKSDQKLITSSRDLATQVSSFLYSQGIWHTFTFEDRPEGARRYVLLVNYRKEPALINLMLPRMRDKDKARVQAQLGSCALLHDNCHWGQGFLRRMDSLKEIASPETFYDLTVDEDASFIACGVTVHNCPAFLFWGAQWNLNEGDALYGKPREKLQAPTDPQRFQNIICKHVKVVADKLAPLVEKILNRYRSEAAKKKHEEDLQQIETEKIVQQQETEEAEKKQPKQKSEPVQDKTKKKEVPDKQNKTKKKEPELEKKNPVKEVIKKKEPVPSNVTVVDDDDDEIIKINRLLKALPSIPTE